MLVLLCVALWFILRGDLFYVLPCVFSVLLALQLPCLGKRELILVLFVRLFNLRLFGFVCFLFLLASGKGCGLWLWDSLDFSLTFLCHIVHFSDLRTGLMQVIPQIRPQNNSNGFNGDWSETAFLFYFRLATFMINLAVSSENLPSCMRKACGDIFLHMRKIWSGNCCPLKRSIVSNASVCGQQKPRIHCASAQADLGFRCPHMPEDTFLHGEAELRYIVYQYSFLTFPEKNGVDTWCQ